MNDHSLFERTRVNDRSLFCKRLFACLRLEQDVEKITNGATGLTACGQTTAKRKRRQLRFLTALPYTEWIEKPLYLESQLAADSVLDVKLGNIHPYPGFRLAWKMQLRQAWAHAPLS